MNRKLSLGILILLLAAAVVLTLALRTTRKTDDTITLSGTIEVTSTELSFKIAGRVRERLVDEGALVEPGQVVARLDAEELQHEAARQRADVQAAAAMLNELTSGYRREEIAQAEAALARITAEAQRLQTDFGRQQQLYQREVIAARDFDAAKAAHEASQASVREARQRLNLLRSGPRYETIEQARARLAGAQALLALAETRLSHATLRATTGGLVLAKNIEPGEQVVAGTPIVTIGNLDQVWLRCYLSETDLGRVSIGQKATISTDTWPGKKYPGRLTFISPEAEFTPKSVQTAKERVKLVYRIKILLANPTGELKPGMPADAKLELSQPAATGQQTRK